MAHIVWQRFGNVPNFVEPFFGSGGVLLGRPTKPGIETVNDLDGFVSNFWRAIQAAPEETAQWADYPVNENDLTARHAWLTERRGELSQRLEGDPEYFDAKIAGWWVWGISCWIGSGFCDGKGPWIRQEVTPGDWQLVRQKDVSRGITRQLPHLGAAGRGIKRERVYLGDAGRGVNRKCQDLIAYFQALQARLRHVRVCCGDWSRVCGPTPTFLQGMTGAFLDPPYSEEAGRDDVYSVDDKAVAHQAREWAVANGENPLLRIALCGYEGEHKMPETWECVHWKALGGYGSQGYGVGRENSSRERIWFSPNCLKEPSPKLFE